MNGIQNKRTWLSCKENYALALPILASSINDTDMLLIHPVAQSAIADHFRIQRLARQIHERDFRRAILRLNVRLNAFGLRLHHAHQRNTSRFMLSFVVVFEERNHWLARNLASIGSLQSRKSITASARPPPSHGDDRSANIGAGRKSAVSRSRLAPRTGRADAEA